MKLPFALFLLLSSFGCGYTLKQTENSPMQLRGIRVVFIEPVVNGTFKPGIETVVYNSLLHKFASYKRLRITHNRADAHAILRVRVNVAQNSVSASTASSSLEPKDTGDPNTYVASHYNATLGASFTLVRLKTELPRKPGEEIPEEAFWGSGFSRSKTFQASTQLGIYGTTSHLINESEFDRALQDLSEQISSDAHDSMLQGF